MKAIHLFNRLFLTVIYTMLMVLLSCLLLYGCSLPSENTEANFSQKALYSSKCSSCHRLIEPKKHSPEVWAGYVYKYGKAMPSQQQQKLIDYLQAEAVKKVE